MIVVPSYKNIIKLFFRKERKFYFFVCRRAGYLARDMNLFKDAFRHKSSVYIKKGVKRNNERLEYLGDGVIDFVVAETLYKKFPDKDEGFLSRLRGDLVSRKHLNALSVQLGFLDYIKYGVPVQLEKTHIPGDVVESFVAAIYLDGGMRLAKRFINKYICSDDAIKNCTTDAEYIDFKTQILHWAQARHSKIDFLTAQAGNCRNRNEFECNIKYGGRILGSGRGRSKKEAEQQASRASLRSILGHEFTMDDAM